MEVSLKVINIQSLTKIVRQFWDLRVPRSLRLKNDQWQWMTKNDPRVWPTGMTHESDPRELPTRMTQENDPRDPRSPRDLAHSKNKDHGTMTLLWLYCRYWRSCRKSIHDWEVFVTKYLLRIYELFLPFYRW